MPIRQGRRAPDTVDDETVLLMAMEKLWEYPDQEVAFYSDGNKSVPDFLLGAQYTRRIHLSHEYNWYSHPNFAGDYIKIESDPEWDWERKVLTEQQMLRKTIVTLTERERRNRDIAASAAAVAGQQPGGMLNSWVRRNPFWPFLIGIVVTFAVGWMFGQAPNH